VNDLIGREVMRGKDLENGEMLDMAGLIEGSYFLRLYSDGQLIGKSMLIINQ
jgi:hypothetical protein